MVIPSQWTNNSVHSSVKNNFQDKNLLDNLGVLVDDAARDVFFDTIRTLALLLRFERATPWLIVLHLKPAEPTIFYIYFWRFLFSNNDNCYSRVAFFSFVTSFKGQNDN